MPKNHQNALKKSEKAPKYITERIKIDHLIPGGQAIATLSSGKKALLWNALPGEIVGAIEVTKEKSSYLEGIATEILQPSPQRIAPRDDCYLATSPWQILDYQSELEQKHALLSEIFRQHQIELDVPIQPVATDGQDFHYRNKMEYALYYDHDLAQIRPAFHARGSHHKLPVAQSSLERPEIWQKAAEIIADLNARGEEARKYQSLLLRSDQSGKVSGGLFENHRPHPQFPELSDQLLGQHYRYSPNGFFQINLPVYQLALCAIQPWIDTAKVLDLYAGVGTIGLSVAAGRELTLVECDGHAFREMQRNCQQFETQNNRGQIHPILAKSEDALDYIAPDQTVIFDPPRAGCQPQLLERILREQPPTLVYLSCNPATQARDLKILLPRYDIVAVQPFNFFPRTPHLENLVILQRKKLA